MDNIDFSDALNDIIERMKVDEFSLVNECKNQPFFYKDVGKLHVVAKTVMKKAKSFLKIKYADISLDVRKNPKKYGLDKVTESSLDATVITQKECKEAEEEMFQAEEDAEYLGVLLESATQRKSMIRDLVALYCKNYYADDDMSGEIRKMSNITEDKITGLRRKKAEQRKEKENG